MEVFNPKILDASIRDVSSYLSDNQKVDLLLYAMRCLQFEGRSRTVIENAIQSCLQVSTLTPENVAKARILRARARIASGWHVQAQDDLQAALAAEPDNPEAKALLHQRSVTVEKLLAPLPTHHLKERVSNEIWREIALHLPRRDLKALLFVPHPLSRIASQLLFWELDLHFTGSGGGGSGSGGSSWGDGDDLLASPRSSPGGMPPMGEGGYHHHAAHLHHHHHLSELRAQREEDASHAQRSADILTRIITDPGFASVVRTLRIYALRREREGSIAFQTGMLMNALPRLINLRNVHLSSTSDGIVPVLRILQTTSPRLRGLSLKSPDGPADLSFLEFRHLAHFSYTTSASSPSSPPSTAALHTLIAQNKTTLKSIALDLASPSPLSPSSSSTSSTAFSAAAQWVFPAAALSIRNLTSIFFTGTLPAHSTLFEDILTNGRQLETLDIACAALECTRASVQIRAVHAADPDALPFLRHFALRVTSLGRRSSSSTTGSSTTPAGDRDLVPAIAEFLRGRRGVRSLQLVVPDESVQRAVGFDAACWGVLPSLINLRGLMISYPPDLAPGLAAWLIPRGVLAMRLTLDCVGVGVGGRDAGAFLSQLRHGIPPNLRFVGLSEIAIRSPAHVIELGFPMVRVLRIGNNYWTVHRAGDRASSSGPSGSLSSSISSALYRDSSYGHGHYIASSSSASIGPGGPRSSSGLYGHGIGGSATHPHSHAHTNGGGISSTTASVAVGGSAAPGGRVLAPAGGHASSGSISGTGTTLGPASGMGRISSSSMASGMGGGEVRGEGRTGGGMGMGSGGMGGSGVELEQWPRRRAMYHATEWLEWLGCEDAMIRDPSAFAV